MPVVRFFIMSSRLSRIALAFTLPVLAALGACSTPPKAKLQEDFVSSGASPYTRTFQVTSTEACEGARRALLSQGYMTTLVRPDTVDASKNFQPASDSHFTVEFHIVCTAGDDATNSSIVYANAVQSGYALKKSDTSASVGLSVLGSLSLPIRQNSDAMVKISSETIQSGKFYDGFFNLISHYLANVVRSVPVPSNTVDATPLPVPAPAPALVVTPMSSTPGGNAAPVIMPAPSKEQTAPLAAAAAPVASATPVSATAHAHEAAAASPDSAPAFIESPASDAAALAQ
ncbi:DUF2242 domain-containing protein [Paraburkholderia caribensis]|uniref:DUF2242 domain-containing protein n=1 Tax=Paraburkholderia caribensis TaxID=75105 RepID=UPI00078DE260|nr:DUF2242 domain-containing protein [Paraburkholderia caribensis]AMV46804.1 hypothetical protein ATN79_33180 [Paraburkholderia caribensis]MDR6382218.1 hypothetical protein [Paraburkholderia caribensis]